MKSQIDWLPLSEGSVRPTQGRTLAVMQVSGGSQDHHCDCLQRRLALNILLDEQVIAALARATAALREKDDPAVLDLERVIRTHRIGILKQRAVLGAAGIDV
ncbi:hypothetical protein MKK69_21745 [Methylobacterium sp. J-026]|nr:hypothetical protein [Methylobacterium sp. J-026]